MNREPRRDVQTHPLVEHVFAYARLSWEGIIDVYVTEMPSLMIAILDYTSSDHASASAVYYAMINHATALDLIASKEDKIVTLSRLMSVMAGCGMLDSAQVKHSNGSYMTYRAIEPFCLEQD
jgi:hypothetical protein